MKENTKTIDSLSMMIKWVFKESDRIEMKSYDEISGMVVKKHKNLLGKYFFVISDGIKKVKVEVGKGLYDIYSENDELTIGYMNDKLINIRTGICEIGDIDQIKK